MWSEFLPVQVIAWRMLNRVLSAGWSQDLLDMMYLDEQHWSGLKPSEMAWKKQLKLSIEMLMVSF